MSDPLTYALACLKRAAENGYPWSVSPDEAAALVAEVDRLRAEVERRRDVYDLMGAVEHSANKLVAHEDIGALRERAAVVAWLRERRDIYSFADEIERGEHRREEEG